MDGAGWPTDGVGAFPALVDGAAFDGCFLAALLADGEADRALVAGAVVISAVVAGADGLACVDAAADGVVGALPAPYM